MRLAIALTVLAFAALPKPATAQTSTAFQMLEAQVAAGSGSFFSLVAGAGYALFLANGTSIERGAQPLFCQPSNLGMGGKDFGKIAIEYYRNNRMRFDESVPVEVSMTAALYHGMRSKYPCR
jgi:hypothetical protein